MTEKIGVIEFTVIKLPKFNGFIRIILGIVGVLLVYIGLRETFNTPTNPDLPPEEPVIAYADVNFLGAKQTFDVGAYGDLQGQIHVVGNDTISSLQVKAGY